MNPFDLPTCDLFHTITLNVDDNVGAWTTMPTTTCACKAETASATSRRRGCCCEYNAPHDARFVSYSHRDSRYALRQTRASIQVVRSVEVMPNEVDVMGQRTAPRQRRGRPENTRHASEIEGERQSASAHTRSTTDKGKRQHSPRDHGGVSERYP